MPELVCEYRILTMRTLLSQVFEKAASLPDIIQDALAAELLDEIEWENKDKRYTCLFSSCEYWMASLRGEKG
jgi:hypothetical protein